MPKLKLGPIADDKPIKLTVELPASLHRDLVAYGLALAGQTGQTAIEPAKLIAPMLARFIATDRAFAKLRRDSTGLGGSSRLDTVAEEGDKTPDRGVLKPGQPDQ